MKALQSLNNRFFTFYFIHLTFLLIFQSAYASKFNPKVKVRTQVVEPEVTPSSQASNEVHKSKNCAGVNCMPQPVPAPGSPECRPRYDGDSCCPTWICASDEILAKSLFDKDNNWNVKHEYQHDMFDIDDHEDEFPPRETSPGDSKDAKKEKFQEYAAKGKLDNSHNKNFINRLHHEEPVTGPTPSSSSQDKGHRHSNSGPSIADNYADYKRFNKLNNRGHHEHSNLQ